jgi:hypothetical protein
MATACGVLRLYTRPFHAYLHETSLLESIGKKRKR